MTVCPDCQHEHHAIGDRECETVVQHGPSRWHRCLCLNRPAAETACPPQMDCQGGTLRYADIWILQRGGTLRGADGRLITPDVLTTPPPRRRLTELEHTAAWHAIEGAAGQEGADPGTVLAAVLRALDVAPPARDCPACEVGIEHDVHCPTPESHNWGCGCPTDKRPTEEQRTILVGEISVSLERALRTRGHTAAADEIVYILLEDVLAAEGAGA